MACQVRLYSVWNNKLFDIRYYGIGTEVLNNPGREYTILYEHELPVYEEWQQRRGYCQTSCMIHLYKNPELMAGLDYIGFIQYDMKPGAEVIKHIEDTVALVPGNSANKPVVFCEMTHTVGQIVGEAHGICFPYENSVLQHYNKFFSTNITHDDILRIITREAPLLNTFVMPKAMFVKMMEWMNILMPWLDDNYGSITDYYRAGFGERIHSFFIALENVDLVKMKVEHICPL